MNELLDIDWEDIRSRVRWYGYACIIPEAVTGKQQCGHGSGCWEAMRNAGGVQLADSIVDAECNGGRQSEFHNDPDILLDVSIVYNCDEEPLAMLFR